MKHFLLHYTCGTFLMYIQEFDVKNHFGVFLGYDALPPPPTDKEFLRLAKLVFLVSCQDIVVDLSPLSNTILHA